MRPPKSAIIAASDAGWSSLAARRAHNPKVTGSNPVPATKQINSFYIEINFLLDRFKLRCIMRTSLTQSVGDEGPGGHVL